MKTIINTFLTVLLFVFLLAGAYGQNKDKQIPEQYLTDIKDTNILDSSYGVNGKSRVEIAEDLILKLPTDENFLYLSLIYHQEGMYKKSIEACKKALELQPDYAEAYNNICSAYNQLGEWVKALQACDSSLMINPEYQLAKNNRQRSLLYINAHKTIEQNPTPDGYINLGLMYYYDEMYKESIKYFEKTIEKDPKNATAYNNICSAYNVMQKWDEAIKACEKAISLEPDFQRAKNNLNYSKSMKGDK